MGTARAPDACVQVRTGRDDTALMKTLTDYLTDNDLIIRNYFNVSQCA